MSSVIDRKKQIVEEIKEKIESSQGAVLVDYRGLNVAQVTELREKYREAGVDYKVYKNTMMRFAFEDLGLEEFNEHLVGPNAIAFGFDDPVQAAKITHEFAKENENLEIKAGLVSGKMIDVEAVKSLASLPSKEVLIAKTLAGFNAPITGFVNVLQGNMRNLVYALEAIREKKESEAA